MYIIIVGGGKVGYYLAKQLVEDGHEVLVIEKDAAKCQQIADELGDIVLRGDGCEGTTLEAAGTGRADLFIAVTGDDEDNLVACQVAKNKFDVPRARWPASTTPRTRSYSRSWASTPPSAPPPVILANIEQELPSHPLIPLLTLKGRRPGDRGGEGATVLGDRRQAHRRGAPAPAVASSPSSSTRKGCPASPPATPPSGLAMRWWR